MGNFLAAIVVFLIGGGIAMWLFNSFDDNTVHIIASLIGFGTLYLMGKIIAGD
jgi:hypothetical protein